MMELTFKQIILKPGQQLLLNHVTWQQLENILAELGYKRAARIS